MGALLVPHLCRLCAACVVRGRPALCEQLYCDECTPSVSMSGCRTWCAPSDGGLRKASGVNELAKRIRFRALPSAQAQASQCESHIGTQGQHQCLSSSSTDRRHKWTPSVASLERICAPTAATPSSFARQYILRSAARVAFALSSPSDRCFSCVALVRHGAGRRILCPAALCVQSHTELGRFACRVILSSADPRARFRAACNAPQLKPDASSLIVALRCLDLQVLAMYFDAGRSQAVVEELSGLQVIRRAQRCNFEEHLKLRGCPGGGLLMHWQRRRLAVAFRRTLLRAGGRLSSNLSQVSFVLGLFCPRL